MAAPAIRIGTCLLFLALSDRALAHEGHGETAPGHWSHGFEFAHAIVPAGLLVVALVLFVRFRRGQSDRG